MPSNKKAAAPATVERLFSHVGIAFADKRKNEYEKPETLQDLISSPSWAWCDVVGVCNVGRLSRSVWPPSQR